MPTQKKIPLDDPKHYATTWISGTITSLMSAPFDRVKTLLQIQHTSLQLTPETRYKGIGNCLKRIYTEEGPFALWRGNMASIYKLMYKSTLLIPL